VEGWGEHFKMVLDALREGVHAEGCGHSLCFWMNSTVTQNLAFELNAVKSDSYRFDIIKQYVPLLTHLNLLPFLRFVLPWFGSDSYRFDVLEIVLRKHAGYIGLDDAGVLIQYLQSDSYRFDYAKLLYRLPTQCSKNDIRSTLLTHLRSDSYRSDWLQFSRPTTAVSEEGEQRAPAVRRSLEVAAISGEGEEPRPVKRARGLLPSEDASKEQAVAEGDATTPTCCLCLSMRVTMSLFPCGHTNTCYACVKKSVETQKVCPTCRKEVEEIKRVFI
jgi:hypothetical protein